MMDHEISSINFKIISLNVRGLNNSIKRRKIFKWLHMQTAHCYFLQKTFSTEQSITPGDRNGVEISSTATDQTIAKV